MLALQLQLELPIQVRVQVQVQDWPVEFDGGPAPFALVERESRRARRARRATLGRLYGCWLRQAGSRRVHSRCLVFGSRECGLRGRRRCLKHGAVPLRASSSGEWQTSSRLSLSSLGGVDRRAADHHHPQQFSADIRTHVRASFASLPTFPCRPDRGPLTCPLVHLRLLGDNGSRNTSAVASCRTCMRRAHHD
jgi:hypothetical protein